VNQLPSASFFSLHTDEMTFRRQVRGRRKIAATQGAELRILSSVRSPLVEMRKGAHEVFLRRG